MITKKEDLYGTYVLNDRSGAIELYLNFINSFGISSKTMSIEKSALALEVCKVRGEHRALWVVHDLNALDPKSKRLTLSDLKPRTRTEYEKVTESIFGLRDEFERGELYCKFEHAREYTQITNAQTLSQDLHRGCCYRLVEKEIDWQDEVVRFMEGEPKIGKQMKPELLRELNIEWDHMTDGDFLEMCRVALRANGEIE